VNWLLQGKYEQAVEGAGRFLVNSTLGIAAIVDIASGSGLWRYDEDLGQTLAVWASRKVLISIRRSLGLTPCDRFRGCSRDRR